MGRIQNCTAQFVSVPFPRESLLCSAHGVQQDRTEKKSLIAGFAYCRSALYWDRSSKKVRASPTRRSTNNPENWLNTAGSRLSFHLVEVAIMPKQTPPPHFSVELLSRYCISSPPLIYIASLGLLVEFCHGTEEPLESESRLDVAGRASLFSSR